MQPNTPVGLRTVRLLISSPGDVIDERERARQVIESLRRRYARRLILKHVLWEDLPLQPDMPFQHGIDQILLSDQGVDIGVFILWSRLGSPVGALPRGEGAEYRSGTEREFDIMVRARAQSAASGTPRPDILVYRRLDDNSFHENLRGLSTQEQQGLIDQKNLVEAFFTQEFNETGTGASLRAHHTYDRPAQFATRLRTHLQRLLDQLGVGQPEETVWDPDTQGPPYMGLEAFDQRHADVFFGREEDVLEARHALRQQARNGCAFLLLCGASGSGKSSLARAGILPAIVENELDERVTAWRTLILTPFELAPDPIASLVSRLAAAEVLPELLGDTSAADFVEVLRRDPEAACKLQLGSAFARADHRSKGSVRLLLVLDQLEELFASAAINVPHRTGFFSLLEALARHGRVWILATVRADFYEQVQDEPSLVRLKSGLGQLDVLPPSPDGLRRLVEEPAYLAGLRFERLDDGKSLSDHILRDAIGHPELLPLVEDLLRELYEHRSGNQMTFAAYAALGNSVEGALARRAERVLSELQQAAQESLDSVLQALVTLGENASDLSYMDIGATHAGGEHVVRQRAFLSAFPEGSASRQLVDRFISQRLFTGGKHPGTGVAIVTVAHENLLRAWPRAVNWAESNRDFLHTRAHVAQRLKEGSPLLDGDPLLGAARDHLARNPDGFPPDLRQFIASSVQAVEEKRHREHASRVRRRRQIYAAAATSVLAFATFLQWASYRRTQDAIAGQLAAESEIGLAQRDYARAEIAAAGALSYRDTPETRQLLIDARSGGVTFLGSSTQESPEPSLTIFSGDGLVQASVLHAGENVVVAISSTKDRKETWRVTLPSSATDPDTMAFSEPVNGTRQIAIAWADGTPTEERRSFHVDLWSLTPGRPVEGLRELVDKNSPAGRHTKRIPSIVFHPRQRWIATSGEDKKLCLWDYAGPQPTLIWEQENAHGTAVHGIAFNSDGTFLASGGGDYEAKLWPTAEMLAKPRAPMPAGKIQHLVGHHDSVFAVAFSKDGTRLASAGYDRTVRIWDLTLTNAAGQHPTVGTLSGHEGTVVALSFSDDGKLLTSGGKAAAARLWDVTEGRLIANIPAGTGEIRSLVLRGFDSDLLVGGVSGWSAWSVRGRPMVARIWNSGATIGAITFDPTGRYLAAGGSDGLVRIWDREKSFTSPVELTPGLDGESINGIAFSSDGRWLAAGGEGSVIHVWDRERNWAKVTPNNPQALKHDGAIWGLCFDPEGKWLASGNTGNDIRIRLWNLDDWTLKHESTEKLIFSVYSLACAPGGMRLVAGKSNGTVAVHETDRLGQKYDKPNVTTPGDRNVWSVAVTESPISILSGNSDGRVRRWIPAEKAWTGVDEAVEDVTSAEDAKVNPTINSISHSKKYGWIAAGGDGPSVEIYDAQLDHVQSLKGTGGTVWSVAFDPGGSRLAFGGIDRILRVFDLDEMERTLKQDSAQDLYKTSQEKTGLTLVDGKVVFSKPARK